MQTPSFHIRPASHGYAWIRDAFYLYWKHPLIWISFSSIIVVVGYGTGYLLGPVGAIVFQLITPVLLGGWMLACNQLEHGRPADIRDIFSAFNTHYSGRLVTVGGIYMTGMLIVFWLPGLFGNDPMIHALVQAVHTNTASQTAAPAPLNLPFSPVALLVLLVTLFLFTAILMLYWFAPTLIVLNDMLPIEAMKLSFRTCQSNFPAFLLYGFLMVFMMVIGSIPGLLGLLIVIPVGFLCYYTAWRDLFDDPEVVQATRR